MSNLVRATDPSLLKRFHIVRPVNTISRLREEPIDHKPPSPVPVQPLDYAPGPSTVIRCPLPQITASPDSLRQFYNGNVVPQIRVIPIKSLIDQ